VRFAGRTLLAVVVGMALAFAGWYPIPRVTPIRRQAVYRGLGHRAACFAPPSSVRGEGLCRPRARMRPPPDASPQPWHEPVADVARVVDVAVQLAT
jgi:hypothetical protein